MTSIEYIEQIKRLEVILGFKIPMDGMLTVILKRPVIDIAKLDDRLLREYHYEGSMNQFVRSSFGQEAILILDENLKF